MKQLALSKLKLDSQFITSAVIKLMKQDILQRFNQTKEVTDEDWEFCEQIDWHPVDELPMKESFIKKHKEIEKGPHHSVTMGEIDELMRLK
jgi:hypothetical protein